jgi:hypothetical protein
MGINGEWWLFVRRFEKTVCTEFPFRTYIRMGTQRVKPVSVGRQLPIKHIMFAINCVPTVFDRYSFILPIIVKLLRI